MTSREHATLGVQCFMEESGTHGKKKAAGLFSYATSQTYTRTPVSLSLSLLASNPSVLPRHCVPTRNRALAVVKLQSGAISL